MNKSRTDMFSTGGMGWEDAVAKALRADPSKVPARTPRPRTKKKTTGTKAGAKSKK